MPTQRLVCTVAPIEDILAQTTPLAGVPFSLKILGIPTTIVPGAAGKTVIENFSDIRTYR